MIVSVTCADGTPLWDYGPGSRGTTIYDPRVLTGVISALQAAVGQAEGQLSCCSDNVEAIVDFRRSSAEIQHNIPLPVLRNRDADREMRVITAVVAETASGSVKAEIGVVEQHDVASMGTVRDNNIASF
jgi:hypothetical protein